MIGEVGRTPSSGPSAWPRGIATTSRHGCCESEKDRAGTLPGHKVGHGEIGRATVWPLCPTIVGGALRDPRLRSKHGLGERVEWLRRSAPAHRATSRRRSVRRWRRTSGSRDQYQQRELRRARLAADARIRGRLGGRLGKRKVGTPADRFGRLTDSRMFSAISSTPPSGALRSGVISSNGRRIRRWPYRRKHRLQ